MKEIATKVLINTASILLAIVVLFLFLKLATKLTAKKDCGCGCGGGGSCGTKAVAGMPAGAPDFYETDLVFNRF